MSPTRSIVLIVGQGRIEEIGRFMVENGILEALDTIKAMKVCGHKSVEFNIKLIILWVVSIGLQHSGPLGPDGANSFKVKNIFPDTYAYFLIDFLSFITLTDKT